LGRVEHTCQFEELRELLTTQGAKGALRAPYYSRSSVNSESSLLLKQLGELCVLLTSLQLEELRELLTIQGAQGALRAPYFSRSSGSFESSLLLKQLGEL